jgi:hypothetical protein
MLQGARVASIVGELVAARVPQHVLMRKLQLPLAGWSTSTSVALRSPSVSF